MRWNAEAGILRAGFRKLAGQVDRASLTNHS